MQQGLEVFKFFLVVTKEAEEEQSILSDVIPLLKKLYVDLSGITGSLLYYKEKALEQLEKYVKI